MDAKKILLFGLGFFQRGLLENISRTRACVVVDTDHSLLEHFSEDMEGLETVHGEASSIVTWKKIDLQNISHIVSSVQDYDVVMEICRIAREVHKLDIPIIISWYKEGSYAEFGKFNAKVVNPLEIGVEAVMGLIDKNYAKPTNIGLGLGEIVEVSILRKSNILDRKLRNIGANKWRVVIAYRDNKMVIPDGDFKLKVGDKAVIIGEPRIVENIVNILMKGTHDFPLQYGQIYAILLEGLQHKDIDEITWFRGKTRAKKIISYDVEKHTLKDSDTIEVLESYGSKSGGELRNFRNICYQKDIGMIVLSAPKKFTIFNSRMRYFFKKSTVPFFLSRGAYPYEEVIISLNGKYPDRLIEMGHEIAELLNITFRYVYISPLGSLKSKADDDALKLRQGLISDFENLNRKKVKFNLLEGNPVKETLKIIGGRQHLLLIVSANSTESIGFLSPHVSYLLAARSNVSVLALPDEFIHE